MASDFALVPPRVGWWAGTEPAGPLAALSGWLLRQEIVARLPGLSPLLVLDGPASWSDPGFTGEVVAQPLEWPAGAGAPLDVFVASGAPEPAGPKLAQSLAEAGTACVAVAPGEAWGLEPRESVGAPFGAPEPSLLASRHLGRPLLEARCACLRVVEGLPERYVLVESALLHGAEEPSADLELALAKLSQRAGEGARAAQVVRLAPGPLCSEDPEVESALVRRREETEEARFQAEDWPGYLGRPGYLGSAAFPLRITSPLDLAASVAGAGAVVATSGALMALAWALGVPHVGIGEEESAVSNFAAWTGDASAVAAEPAEVVATLENIFARRGSPPGLKRLEATMDEALDGAASGLGKVVAEAAARGSSGSELVRAEERAHELQAANEALRMRMAAERLRFGQRAALLEKTAHTTVESAIKAVHGQDVMVRRRLEETEREMKRLQEETAVQQAELREIRGALTWRALAPLRDLYKRAAKTAG